MRQVKEACQIVAKSFGLEQTVKLAFTVVTKKVNMRVFKKQGEGLVNPEPGTVVDSVVTRPERFVQLFEGNLSVAVTTSIWCRST